MSKNKLPKTVATDPKVEQKRSPIEYVLAQQKFRVRQDIASLKLAIESANTITNYSRFLLHNVFREVMMDTMVTSQWESRKMKTKEKEFRMVKKNAKGDSEENENLTAIFENSWFLDWIDGCLDSKLWGFTLMDFGQLEDGIFQQYKVTSSNTTRIYDPVTIIDRDCVKPEFGIITQTYGMNTGVSFSDPEYKDFLMFVGQTHDFGLLFKLAKYVLFKNNCLGNWSEWIEVFGMDKRVGYTRAQDAERINFLKAMRDLGNNAYGVFSEGDKVEYIGSQRTDAYKVYEQFLKYTDEQIAKVIFGQDVVTNNTGRVVGEVGENVSNMYGDTDAKFIARLVNGKLIPFMENLGVNFDGHIFEWDTDEKLTMIEKADRDLKISQMGKVFTDEYIEETYGVMLDETPDPSEAIKGEMDGL